MTFPSAIKSPVSDSGTCSGYAIAGPVCEAGVSKEDADLQSGTLLSVARTPADVERLRSFWTDWCQHPSASPDAFLSQLRHERGSPRPFILALWRDGQPECLLAASLANDHLHFSFGGVRLLLPKARLIRVETGCFVGQQSDENSRLMVNALLTALHSREADCVEFSNLRTDSPLFRWATQLPGFFCRDYCPPRMAHCILALAGSFEDFYRGLSRKKRRSCARSARAIAEAFPRQVHICELGSATDLNAFLHDCDLIARKTYQRSLNTGFVNDKATREIMNLYQQQGKLWGYLLYLAERPAAFILGVGQDGALYPLYMAYQPQYRHLMPGQFLLMHCIRQVRSWPHEITTIDFGHGNHRYKREICNQELSEASVTIVAPYPKWIAVNLLRTTLALIRQGAIRVLGHSGWRDAGVRAWRRFVIKKRTLTAKPSRY